MVNNSSTTGVMWTSASGGSKSEAEEEEEESIKQESKSWTNLGPTLCCSKESKSLVVVATFLV
jgi:hypothetical protein